MLLLHPIQQALYNALTAALAPIPVRDKVGPDRSYPYGSIGESITLPDDPLNDGIEGNDTSVTIHLWSRQPGMQEIQEMMEKTKNGLHYKVLALAGAQWVNCIFEFAQTMIEADGITRHGVMRFRISTFT